MNESAAGRRSSPPYAAPERESGAEWGAAADVFALGAIAHEVLTGRRALPGSEEPLPGLDDIKVHDAAALRELLESAFDQDPERRPATATDFATAFAVALGLERPRCRGQTRRVPNVASGARARPSCPDSKTPW